MLLADLNIMDLLQRNTPNFSRNKSGMWKKVALGVQNRQYLWNG